MRCDKLYPVGLLLADGGGSCYGRIETETPGQLAKPLHLSLAADYHCIKRAWAEELPFPSSAPIFLNLSPPEMADQTAK